MKKFTFIFILLLICVFLNTNETSAQISGGPKQKQGSATIKGGPVEITDSATIKGGPTQTNNPQASSDIEKLEDPLGPNVSLEGLLLKLFEIVLYVGVPLVAFFLIWSGFMFVSAQGNPEKIETAKSRLVWTIIGAVLLLGAWTISQAIKGTIEDIKRGGTSYLQKKHFSSR